MTRRSMRRLAAWAEANRRLAWLAQAKAAPKSGAAKRGAPAQNGAKGSNLHQVFFFLLERRVDELDVLVRVLLDVFLGLAGVVF